MQKKLNATGLRAPGKHFYQTVLSEYELVDHHDLERLTQACKCLDEISEAEAIIKAEGRYITDRFGQRKEHPAGRAIRDSRTLFFRAIRELGLDLSTGPESRIPGRY